MLTDDSDISSIQTQIDVCTQESEQLNGWELQFIESISDQLTRNGNLSNKQIEMLQKIYDRVV